MNVNCFGFETNNVSTSVGIDAGSHFKRVFSARSSNNGLSGCVHFPRIIPPFLWRDESYSGT